MCRRKLKENRVTGKKATANKGFNKNVKMNMRAIMRKNVTCAII